MKLKHLLLSLMTVCFIAFLTVSCGPDNPPQEPEPDPKDTVGKKEQMFHYGNCKKNDCHGRFFSSENQIELSAATLIQSAKIQNYGNKIVGLRVYLGDGELSNTSVFMGGDFQYPDKEIQFACHSGWNVVLFDEPVDIPQQDFYIGCSLSGSGNLLGYEQAQARDTELIKLGEGWSRFNEIVGNYLWSIQAIVSGGDYSVYAQDDIVIENVRMPYYAKVGETVEVSCEVRNNGVHWAENLKITCNVAGTSYTYPIPEKIVHGRSVVVTFPDVIVPDRKGFSDVDVEASISANDNNPDDNQVKRALKIYPVNAPVRKAVLAEIFTAQSCPHCGPGDEKFYNVLAGMPAEYRDRVAAVAHHLDWFEDSFVIPESNELADVIDFFGIPTLLIDRAPADYEGGYMFDGHPGEIDFDAMKLQIDEPALATIEMTRLYDSSTRNLEVSVNGVCDENEIYVTILLLQDGFVDWQSYNGRGTIYDFEHHDVVRAFVTKIDGDRITLGADGSYSADYTFAIPQNVTDHACDVDRMSVVAFVHGNVSDEDKREVYNAIKMPVLE